MIVVLAGTNGGGKSSIGGEMLRQSGAEFFNPDSVARQLLEVDPSITVAQANGRAWTLGRELLERAIEQRRTWAFETTLGGRTITQLLVKAANVGIPVRVWYVGLASPELHLSRVRARVERGGHDIPEPKIRERYDGSRANLIRLLPHLAELRVYDNSVEAPPEHSRPAPQLMLNVLRGRILAVPPGEAPDWVKPVLASAYRLFERSEPGR